MKRHVHLAELLKYCREAANKTQKEVSDKLGYSTPQFISNMERGISAIPDFLLPKFSRLYCVNVDKLIDAAVKDYRVRLERRMKTSRG